MDSEIELISDGDGLAVIGDPGAVERFLASEGLPSEGLGLPRLSRIVAGGAATLQAGSEIAAQSGRWVKLTAESAEKVRKYGLTPTKVPGINHAMAGQPGDIKGWLQIATGPRNLASNPAVLAGGAGIMAQLAMQQTMAEITDYLERIDEKLDDVLRSQNDAVLAQMIGVGLQVDEAMTIREHVGRVNEVTWSKVQDASGTIAETQAYVLLQLDALAEKFEKQSKVGDLSKTARDAETKAGEWIAVLARCFQLLDAIAVLEIDRVLETSPDDVDGHRLGLKAARNERLDAIARTTARLTARMETAAHFANAKVLLHPASAPAIVTSNAHVADVVGDFHELLGIPASKEAVEARRWVTAATELRDKALETGSDGVEAAKRLGNETRGKARSAADQLSSRITKRAQRPKDEVREQ